MKYKVTESMLTELERYAPPMPDQAEQRIRARTLEKIHGKRRNTYTRAIRRMLAVVCAAAVLTTGVAAVTINVDLTGLYEPIFGARGALFLQGINKSSNSNGITLTVDMGYSDGENAMVFFTLTDTEEKGRITDDLNIELDFSTWYSYLMRDEDSYFRHYAVPTQIDLSDDHQKGQFYVTLTEEEPIGEKLLIMGVNGLKSDHGEEEILIDFDISAYFEDPDGTEGKKLPLPIEGGGWLTGLTLTDKGLEIHTEYPGGSKVDDVACLYLWEGKEFRGTVWNLVKDTGETQHWQGTALQITEAAQLENANMYMMRYWSDGITDVNLRTTFRLDTQGKAEEYTLNVPAWGGNLETVKVTPADIVLTGTGFWEYEWMRQATERDLSFRMVTKSGQPVPYISEGNTWREGTFTKRFIGIIPDDLIALEIGGILYTLEDYK